MTTVTPDQIKQMSAAAYYAFLVQCSLNGDFPSHDNHGNCRYRCPDGRKCAVGQLIPEPDYTHGIEGRLVRHLSHKGIAGITANLPPAVWAGGDPIDVLTILQNAHDCALSTFNYADGKVDFKWDHATFVKRLNQIPAFAALGA